MFRKVTLQGPIKVRNWIIYFRKLQTFFSFLFLIIPTFLGRRRKSSVSNHQARIRAQRSILRRKSNTRRLSQREAALNPVPEDEVFISHENGETMVKKKFHKTLILKSPTSAPVASTSSTVLHKEKDQPPKEKGKYLEIITFKMWFFSLYSKSSLAHVAHVIW